MPCRARCTNPKRIPSTSFSLRSAGVSPPNVSLVILNLTLDRETSKEEINTYLRDVALNSPLQRQIDFTNSPDAVSSDFVGSRHACIVDGTATLVEGKRVVLYVWYDNEFGYSRQVVRCLEELAGIVMPNFPKRAAQQASS